MVELSTGPCFIGVGDILTEIVDGDTRSELIDRRRSADCVRDLSASDKPRRSSLADTGLLGDVPKPAAFRERDEQRPQHKAPDSFGIGLPAACIGITVRFTTRSTQYLVVGTRPKNTDEPCC